MRCSPAILVLVSFSAPAAAQTTWYVDLDGAPPGSGTQAEPYVSIQQAIDAPATLEGDTILVLPGVYHETIDYHERYLIVRSTDGPLATTLMPAQAADPVVVRLGTSKSLPPAVLEGFTIRRDPPASGTGVRTSFAAARLVRCIVTGHAVGCNNGYDLFFEECTVTGNTRGVEGSSASIHHLDNTICHRNGQDFVPGIFWPCLDTAWSCYRTSGLKVCSAVGNTSADPRFWNEASGDFRLRPDSPCIDTGDPARTDPDGTRLDMGALTFDPYYAPGTSVSCYGSNALCPCGNGGSGLGGCDIAQGTGGLTIAVRNFTPNGTGGGTAEVVGGGYPPASQPGVTLIRSPAMEPAPVVFGDGLRCISSAGLVRVSAVLASGGASVNTVNHGAGAGTFHYQLWVRNQPVTYCDPAAAFNLSSALSITWP